MPRIIVAPSPRRPWRGMGAAVAAVALAGSVVSTVAKAETPGGPESQGPASGREASAETGARETAQTPKAVEEPASSELAVRVQKLEEELVGVRGSLRAQAGIASQPSPNHDWSIGGYGETLLSTRFYNPDPKKGGSSYRQSDIDLARVSFFINSTLASWLTFGSELELEHGGTGVTREVEWDEFGEYEVEVEKGGEIVLEQAYLEARLPWGFRLRGGHLLVPVGMTTNYHLPTMFSSVRRPESETHLIPAVWHETGAELIFRTRGVRIQLQIASGLDSTGFSSERWVAGGSQRAFESALINDPGVALALEYTGLRHTLLGLSGYTSNSTHNRPKREMDNVDARVFMGDVHLRGHYGPLQVRALALLGTLANADRLSAANASLSSALGASRTPVGSAAYACFLEAAVDVLAASRLSTRQRLDLFGRYDAYDTMWRAPKDVDNPLMQRQVLTTGVNYFPHPRVVLKAEYVSRWINQNNAWGLRQGEVNALLGFVL